MGMVTWEFCNVARVIGYICYANKEKGTSRNLHKVNYEKKNSPTSGCLNFNVLATVLCYKLCSFSPDFLR